MNELPTPQFLTGDGEMAALIRQRDWSDTALGPIDKWPQSLRTIISTCINSRFPILIWWGPELTMIYNDAYIPLIGTKHPIAFGSRGKDIWLEIWDIIGPMLDGVLMRGESTWSENQLLIINRHGFPEECYFTFAYSPIYVESGGIGGIFTAVNETTTLILAERQLLAHRDHIEQLNAELEQKVAERTQVLLETLEELEKSKDGLARALATERELGDLKSRFVSMASHEFRTPLTTVLSSASLLERYTEGDQQDKRQRHISRIQTAVNNLNNILEEFLSVGKLEEGKIKARSSEVDVNQLVSQVVADIRDGLKPTQRIVTQLMCTAPVWIDPSLLSKILVNLLSNALKYSRPDSVVTIQGVYMTGQLILTVEDEGIGISKEDQIHLFERFFRARNVTNIAGTGLGLHIVGHYVKLMGGEVSLRSELNKGTTVTLTLPC
ncbi:sensor histidine kinase [Spirosoma aerophilum]